MLEDAAIVEAKLARELRLAGPAKPRKTLWQAAGVVRGETELEVEARVRIEQLEAVRGGTAALATHKPRDALLYIEQYTSALCVGTAGLLGAVYGGVRGYARAWWADVTPYVCRELAMHVSRRTALGAMLLVGLFEAAPRIKEQTLQQLGKVAVTEYAQEGALQQLVAIDCAYLGAIAVLNFAFPYILIPVAFNPAQLLVLPADHSTRAPPKEL